jgi:Carbohydrate family 9 binding domain-like
LDGKLDDDGWKQAVMTPLLPNRQDELIKDDTRFLLTWDDEFIYIAARVGQAWLNPVLNNVYKTTVKNTKRDSRVYKDDSIEIFLCPPKVGVYYQFVVNMAGAVYDTRNKNSAWNCNIKTAVNKNKDFWTVEIAIPQKDLKIAKLDNNTWRANFYRNNPQNDETSAWNPTNGYFNDQKKFGILKFSNAPLVVQCKNLQVQKKVAQAQMSWSLGSDFQVKGAVETDKILSPKANNIHLIMQANSKGNGQLTIYEKDNIIYRSAMLQLEDIASKLDVDIACPNSKIELYLNNKKLASAQQQLKSKIEINQQINIIALKVNSADLQQLKGKFTQDNINFSFNNWLVSEKAQKGWKELNFNAAKWKTFTGKFSGKTLYMRCKFVANKTLFAPQLDENTFYMMNKVAQKVSFRLGSPFSTPLKNHQFHLAVPKQITLPVYQYSKRRYNRYKNSRVKKESDKYNEFIFQFKSPIPKLKYQWAHNCLTMVLLPSYKQNPKLNKLSGKIWTSSRGVNELPRNFNIEVLPAPQGKQAVKAKIIFTPDFLGAILTAQEFAELLPGWKNIGINLVGFYCRFGNAEAKYFSKQCKLNNMQTFTLFMNTGHRNFPKILLKNIAYLTQTIKNKPIWSKDFCPLFFTSSKLILERIYELATINDAIMHDIESGVKKSCFCENCRKYFSAKLKITRILSTNEILKQYRAEWIQHVAAMNKKVSSYIFKNAKKAKPNIITMMYSDVNAPVERYGVDWALYKNHVDIPVCGYNESPSLIKKLRKTLNNQAIIPGLILNTNLWQYRYSNQNINARLWFLFIAGGYAGDLIWNWHEFDGRGFTAINDFSRGVAKFEDFFSEKNEIHIKGISSSICRIYKKDNEYLYLLINNSISPLEFRLKLPKQLKKPVIYDFYKNKNIKYSSQLALSVPSENVLLLKISE